MPDITSIRDQISARLAEIESLIEPLAGEAEQLRSMDARFGDGGGAEIAQPATPSRRKRPTKAPARTAGSAKSTPAAKRGRPTGSGNRAQQAVAKISEQPGITASELAKSMGISPNYLYRVLPQLQREAKITKQGRGYHPAATTDPNT